MINGIYNTLAKDEERQSHDIHEISVALIGGLIQVFPDHPERMPVANLTSFYFVLHKTSLRNLTLSTNTTAVTRPQAPILFATGTGRRLNFCEMVSK